ncbi:MAG: hypothetical protein IPP21_08915 [Betaproteobacteria bacterium]|nr:hypothetical protein [Betaproteobacteria bacterium]
MKPSAPAKLAVNVGFNRMTHKPAQIEHDPEPSCWLEFRTICATPLARLRLEAELSVEDATARDNMANDHRAADAIIGKFDPCPTAASNCG